MASAAVLPKQPGTDYVPPRLREANASDAPALAALYAVARPQAQLSTAALREWLSRGRALLVEDALGRVVAALRHWEEGDGWRVEPIVTHPEHRGQGYGRWLMTMLEADAIRSNIPFLALTITDVSVLPYYQRLGYRPVGDDPKDLGKRVGGVWQRTAGQA